MEIATVRRFWVRLLAILLALPLVAVAPAASILGIPTLIVFPFVVNGGDVSKEAGSRLAVAIATQIANLGGVTVKPAPPGVDRQNYLTSAHGENVDYYIAGYVTPLGDGVSVVEQLVSTQTGIVVYSNTAQVRTYEDATGQGDVLRDALLRHQTRNLGAYAAPPPPALAPSPTPAPGAATQANLGRLFGRKQKRAAQSQASATAAPAARKSPTPIANAPTAAPTAPLAPVAPVAPAVVSRPEPQHVPGYGVLAIGGSADTDRRTFTLAAIRNVMIANHQRVADAAGTDQRNCSDAHVGTLVGGNLATQKRTILGQPQTLATFELLAYDCSGSVVYRKTFSRDARGDWKNAVDRVVQTAVAEFLREPAGSRHG